MATRRGVGFVLTFLIVAVIFSMLGVAATYFFVARGPSVPGNATLVLRVPGGLAEMTRGGLLGQLFEAPPTLRSVVDSLRKAAVDSRVSRVVLVPSGGQALWGKIQEVRDAVLAFKASGKSIVSFLEYGGEQQYYLATATDEIYLMPTSPLDLTGVASYELFLRGTFDTIGAYPDLLHVGDYKTASNAFTEKTYTPAHREMAESLNADLYAQLVRGIADGRGRPESEIRALIDNGPFLPEDALDAGLVDELAYEDQVPGADAAEGRRIDGRDYAGVSLQSVGLNTGPKIAVVYVAGVISSGESGYDSTQGTVVGSDTLVRYLREARNDSSIRAIVLRIDSPGGSSIASGSGGCSGRASSPCRASSASVGRPRFRAAASLNLLFHFAMLAALAASSRALRARGLSSAASAASSSIAASASAFNASSLARSMPGRSLLMRLPPWGTDRRTDRARRH